MRWMTWRTMGVVNIARHVIGCHLTQETWIKSALDDVAGNIRQARPYDCHVLPSSWDTNTPADSCAPVMHFCGAFPGHPGKKGQMNRVEG